MENNKKNLDKINTQRRSVTLKVVYSEILLFTEFRFSPSVSFADILYYNLKPLIYTKRTLQTILFVNRQYPW
jgi:hypothetical protein